MAEYRNTCLMPATETRSIRTPEEFRASLLHFINEVLPGLDRKHRRYAPVNSGTPLFESGLLDSLSILHLMHEVELLTGKPVPDHLVLMKHFRTVEAIVTTFSAATIE